MKRATCIAMVFCFAVAISGCRSTDDEDPQSSSDASQPNEARDAGVAEEAQDAVDNERNAGPDTQDSDATVGVVRSYVFKDMVQPPRPPAEVEVPTTDGTRELSFSLYDSQIDAVREGNARFAFDLYHKLVAEAESGDNLIVSPHSISVALAMAYAGARGNTEKEMAHVLHFALSQKLLHPVFNYLALELATRAEPSADGQDIEQNADAEEKEDSGFQLSIVNAAWPAIGFEMVPEYIDVLQKYYNSALYPVSYEDPERAREIINGWVAEQTARRIDDLIPSRLLDSDTVLVLTNAVYFKAAWVNHFDESKTSDRVFHLWDGGDVTVPMMEQQFDFRYAEGESWQAVEIPYEREELSMVLIVPKAASNLTQLEASLSYEQLSLVIEALEVRDTLIRMPKFSFKADFSLKQPLIDLGMVDAFGPADFSGITEEGGISICDVLHNAFIAVDEAGTEAAAATAVIFKTIDGGGSYEQAKITLDRPFIFLIRDNPTGAIVFLGRVVDPTAPAE
ncbi:MAG: serpin family protein [Deltaproteobacteria bacterium]|nr:serpin family protein [Deltaproteobacteria bacterium]